MGAFGAPPFQTLLMQPVIFHPFVVLSSFLCFVWVLSILYRSRSHEIYLSAAATKPESSCFPGSGQGARRESVAAHAGWCVSVLIPRELFRPSGRNQAAAQIRTWPGCCEQTARRSQLSPSPWKTNSLSHLVKTWAKAPLIFLSGQITNGYWLNVAWVSRGVALSSSPCVPACPLLFSWGQLRTSPGRWETWVTAHQSNMTVVLREDSLIGTNPEYRSSRTSVHYVSVISPVLWFSPTFDLHRHHWLGTAHSLMIKAVYSPPLCNTNCDYRGCASRCILYRRFVRSAHSIS